MLIGEFSLSGTDFKFPNGTQSLLTNATDWNSNATGFGMPYVAPVDLGANGTSPWGFLGTLPAAANFIWEPSLSSTAYFSVPIVPRAPQATVDTGSVDAGLVRIGTSGTASVGVSNVGDGSLVGVNLNGSIAAAVGPQFSGGAHTIDLDDPLNGNAQPDSDTYDYSYTPTGHAIDTEIVALSLTNGNPAGDNSAFQQDLTLMGQGVGPVFDSIVAPGGMLDFGDVILGDTGMLTLDLMNTSTDPNGGNSALTDLTILNISFGGLDPGLFSVMGFTPGTVISQGGTLPLSLKFDPSVVGMASAVLTVFTDEDAVLGGSGSVFTYDLKGTGIAPEPITATLALIGLAGLGFATRRRTA